MSRTVRVMMVAWACALGVAILLSDRVVESQGQTEAPAGFDGGTNGFLAEFCANQAALTDSPNSPTIPNNECNDEAAIEEFTGPETIADGLGPIFNAAGCGECHLVPILGGSSQIMEKRAGLFDGSNFIEHPGGSLIQDRSTVLGFQELATPANTNVTTFRATLSILGLGFVEAIPNGTLQAIQSNQPSAQRGTIVNVPVLERPGTTRIGRFGWKDQQASLVSFSADAYKTRWASPARSSPSRTPPTARTSKSSTSRVWTTRGSTSNCSRCSCATRKCPRASRRWPTRRTPSPAAISSTASAVPSAIPGRW